MLIVAILKITNNRKRGEFTVNSFVSWLSKKNWGVRNGIWLGDVLGMAVLSTIIIVKCLNPITDAIKADRDLVIMAYYVQLEASEFFMFDDLTSNMLQSSYHSEYFGEVTSVKEFVELSHSAELDFEHENHKNGSWEHMLSLANFVLTGHDKPEIIDISDRLRGKALKRSMTRISLIKNKYSYGLL